MRTTTLCSWYVYKYKSLPVNGPHGALKLCFANLLPWHSRHSPAGAFFRAIMLWQSINFVLISPGSNNTFFPSQAWTGPQHIPLHIHIFPNWYTSKAFVYRVVRLKNYSSLNNMIGYLHSCECSLLNRTYANILPLPLFLSLSFCHSTASKANTPLIPTNRKFG